MAGSGESSFLVLDEKAYMEDEKMELIRTKQLFQKLYIDRIEENLQRVHKSKSEAADLAQQMLLDGVEVYFNADSSDENLLNANSLSEEYREIIYDRYFLLISAPTSNPKEQLSLADEADARQCQFNNFLQRHYGVKHEPDLNQVHYTTCFTYQEMLMEVEKFLLQTATAATMANIVFNGHGNALGMLLYDENSPVNLDTVINDVEGLVSRRKMSKAGLPIPILVQLVFAQCFAHAREQVDSKNPDLNVISFTSPDKPCTTMSVKKRKQYTNGFKVKVVVDSNHQELNRHAECDVKLPVPGVVTPPPGRLEGTTVVCPSFDEIDMDTS